VGCDQAQRRLLLASFALLGVMILGFMALAIGVLWAFPTVMVAGAFIYRRLSPREPGTGAGVPAAVLPGGPKEWWATPR